MFKTQTNDLFSPKNAGFLMSKSYRKTVRKKQNLFANLFSKVIVCSKSKKLYKNRKTDKSFDNRCAKCGQTFANSDFSACSKVFTRFAD